MNYRLYESADFAQLYAIEESCFEPPLRFSRAYLRRLLNSPRTFAWVAEEDGRLTGFAIVESLQQAEQHIAYVETIEVNAHDRKQGIGGELLRRLEASAQKAGATSIWLHVDAENFSAIRLYEEHGFEAKGRQERYYAGKRAALVYSKPL